MQARVQGKVQFKQFASNESKLVPQYLDPKPHLKWALVFGEYSTCLKIKFMRILSHPKALGDILNGCGGHHISMNFPLRDWDGYYVYL
jgi:hypothetical protein